MHSTNKSHNSLFYSPSSVNLDNLFPDRATKSNLCTRQTKSHNILFYSPSSVNLEKLFPDRATKSNLCTRTGNKVSKQSILDKIHMGLFETYRYKRTGQFFIWNYIGNWYVFSKYLDNYCRYQYCANDTLF